MVSKTEIDTAENVIKTYERAMRDIVKQGHCLSVEWRYKNDSENAKKLKVYAMRFQPEVFDMVKDVLRNMSEKERKAFAILRTQYGYTSPYFKRPPRSALQRNQRIRNNSASWCREVEAALSIFWEYMQKQDKFRHFFG